MARYCILGLHRPYFFWVSFFGFLVEKYRGACGEGDMTGCDWNVKVVIVSCREGVCAGEKQRVFVGGEKDASVLPMVLMFRQLSCIFA